MCWDGVRVLIFWERSGLCLSEPVGIWELCLELLNFLDSRKKCCYGKEIMEIDSCELKSTAKHWLFVKLNCNI
jgi:hypothetical protein